MALPQTFEGGSRAAGVSDRRGLAVTSRIVQIDTKGRVDAAFVVQLLGRISFCFRIS